MTAVAPEFQTARFQSAETSMIEHKLVDSHGLALQTTTLAALLWWFYERRGIRGQRELGQAIGTSQGTARRLLMGEGVPTERVLNGIAAWTHIDITQIREIAGRSRGERRRWVPPREFDQLTPRQRKVLEQAGWAYLEMPGKRVTR